MSSKEKETILSDEIIEIKEIVERTPESVTKKKKVGVRDKKSGGGVSRGVTKLFVGLKILVKTVAEKVCRNPRTPILILSSVGVALLVTVIVLSVRLGGVTKELKSVQAMSTSLQEELEAVKIEQKTEEVPLYTQKVPTEAEEKVMTPKPTQVSVATPTPTPAVEKYIVCVDAGHGDWDGGAVLKVDGVERRIEKNDNLWMAKLFRDALEAYDVEVVMTRETDEYLGLTERAVIANNVNADALISFHRNSFDGENEVNGVEVWLHNSKPEGARVLAESMLAAIMEVGGMENRGVKYGSMSNVKENYEINRKANMTSMIIELGFVTSLADNAAYDTYGEAYAKEMAKAVYEWLEAQKN